MPCSLPGRTLCWRSAHDGHGAARPHAATGRGPDVGAGRSPARLQAAVLLVLCRSRRRGCCGRLDPRWWVLGLHGHRAPSRTRRQVPLGPVQLGCLGHPQRPLRVRPHSRPHHPTEHGMDGVGVAHRGTGSPTGATADRLRYAAHQTRSQVNQLPGSRWSHSTRTRCITPQPGHFHTSPVFTPSRRRWAGSAQVCASAWRTIQLIGHPART